MGHRNCNQLCWQVLCEPCYFRPTKIWAQTQLITSVFKLQENVLEAILSVHHAFAVVFLSVNAQLTLRCDVFLDIKVDHQLYVMSAETSLP